MTKHDEELLERYRQSLVDKCLGKTTIDDEYNVEEPVNKDVSAGKTSTEPSTQLDNYLQEKQSNKS